jgi:hypothetical protein
MLVKIGKLNAKPEKTFSWHFILIIDNIINLAV